MASLKEKVIYRKAGKGSIVYVEDRRFGDNHYVILDKDGNCIDRITHRIMPQCSLSDLLDKFIRK